MIKDLCLLLSLLIVPIFSLADEARPVYVEVNQISQQEYSVQWKIPPVIRAGDEPSIILSNDSCAGKAISSKTGLLGKSFYYCSEANVAFDITLDYPRGNPALTSLVVFKSPYTEPQQIFSGPEITSIPLGQSQSSIDVSEQYLIAGVEHILVGYDHLLFILCLMIIASGFKRLLLTVTGFTVAHSITLSLASLNIIRVRTELVELLIALSILLLAVEIIKHYRVKNYESFTWRYPITASSVFGLLHGFGFAVVLQELGLPKSMKIHALLFFNIGVEIGQIMFISGMAILGYFVSKFLLKISVKREIFDQFAVYVIGISSAYWLFERTSAIFL